MSARALALCLGLGVGIAVGGAPVPGAAFLVGVLALDMFYSITARR